MNKIFCYKWKKIVMAFDGPHISCHASRGGIIGPIHFDSYFFFKIRLTKYGNSNRIKIY